MNQVNINTSGISIMSSAMTGDLAYLADTDENRTFESGVYVETAEDIRDLDIRLTQAGMDIDGANATIGLHASLIDGMTDRISQAEMDIDGANAQIALKASQDGLNELKQQLTEAEIVIDGSTAAIGLHATQITALQATSGVHATQINQAQLDIAANASAISLKASQTDLTALTARVSTAENNISAGEAGTWASISSKLTVATYNADQKDTNNYLRIAALENRFSVYDTTDAAVWSSDLTYPPGSIVRQGTTYYRCTKQSTNDQPPNTTYWTAIAGGLLSQWTLKLNANNRIAGVGMMLDAAGQSEFIVLADKFQVVDPADEDEPKTVFTVGNINGVSGVGINGDLIIDGSIVARNIGANEVIANSANIKDGLITNAHIANAAIEGAKIKDAAIDNAKIASLDASKITSGYLSADRLEAGTITGTKLSVNSLSAISADLGTITAGLAKSSDNCLQIDFNNKWIRVYDPSGILRVELGYLS